MIDQIAEFYADPLSYVLWAFPWGEPGPLEEHDGPDKWQVEQMLSIQKQIEENPLGLIKDATASGHGIGKLHPYDTIIETPVGARRWGDLVPGDQVFGAAGSITEIQATTHYKNVPIYRVTFDDGSYCDVSSGHLWNVRGRHERRKGLTSWRTMETIELLEAGVKRPNGKTSARQWEIPVQGAAEFPEKETALEPYFVGVWLGDGHKGAPRYTKPIPEIANKITACGYALTEETDEKSYYVRGVTQAFDDPVFRLGSHARYVPDEYKYNSIAVRKAVLSGLIDTDGEVHASGSVGYCSTSKRLVDDVIWLARSLGYKAMLQATPKQGRLNGEDKRIAYRCTINMPENLFTHPAKRLKFKPSESRYQKRWIDSIERLADMDGMCITVGAKDGLYLANNFIVTHNSAEVAWIILWAMSTRPHLNGVVTANTFPQLSTKTWRELAVWHKRALNQFWFKWTATKFFHVDHPETWAVYPIANNEANSESFAGQHGTHALTIYDEASAIPDVIWEVSSGVNDPRAMHFVFGNPTRNTGKFRECFGKHRDRWTTRTVDSRDCKMPNKEELARDVEAYGEDSDFVRVRIKGEFPRAASNQFISEELVNAALERDLAPPLFAHYQKIIGVDVARFGDDSSVILTRQGPKAFPAKKFTGIDTMELAAHVVDEFNRENASAVMVDGTGVGSGVVDRLKQLGLPVIDVQFGAQAIDKRTYSNTRAEIWGRMRDWLKGTADLPPDPQLAEDLRGPEYGYNNSMQIQLERKIDMKKRGLSSPDIGDALALTFAEFSAGGASTPRQVVQQSARGWV